MMLLRVAGRFLSAFLLPIRRNAVFFPFMYLLGLVCCYAIVPDNGKSHVYDLTWPELFFDVYTLSALLAVIPKRVRTWVRAVVYVAAYALAAVDLYCYVKFDATLNPTMLLLVGETNAGEASEFVSSYLSMDILTSSVGLVLLLAALNVVVGLWGKTVCRYSGLLLRKVGRGLRRFGLCAFLLGLYKKISGLYSRLIALCQGTCSSQRAGTLAGAVVLALYVVCGSMVMENKLLLCRLMSYENIGDVEHELTKKRHGVQYLPFYRFCFSVYANELAAKQIVRLKASLDGVKVDSCSYRSKTIVLIIGESYNRNHSALYGYPTPNTPRQTRLRRRGELVTFTDVVSPWNLTSFVFKHLFSLYAVGDKGEWCDYPLFPEVFRRAGYHVTFMTNQFLPQAKEAVYDFSGGFFLNDETLSKAQFDTRNKTLYRFDNGLLCEYEKLKDEGKDKPQLIIFHLKGQHVDYRSRSPKVQKKFNSGYYAESRSELSAKERNILSEYDNAVLYNDSIVTAIIDKFRSQDAVVVYVPDHGEEVYDDAHFYGRMHSTEVTPRLAHAEFEIPMWIWASRKYKKDHPGLWNEIRRSSKRPYMTDALPHLLLYLAGISCPHYREDLNVLGEGYNEKRPRILKGQADYDKLMQKEAEDAAKKVGAEGKSNKRTRK